MASFAKPPPSVTLKLTTFQAHIPKEQLAELKQLLNLSKIGPSTYENQQKDLRFGVTRDWLVNAKQYWETKYEWRACEARLNSFPNYTTTIVDDDGESYTMHFIALFSQKAHAVPLLFLHGWPGSVLEFLGILDLLRRKYSPKTLPYHVIVPSAIGCGFSSSPPLDKDFKMVHMARLFNKLMKGLFDTGYISQGGDTGSIFSRILAAKYDECKAIHLNFNVMGRPKGAKVEDLTEAEKKGVRRGLDFNQLGNAYAREHGTRPATIGLVLSSSPLALLSWIGEKFIHWTDETPHLDAILDSVTLYWLTETFPRHIYHYREMFGHGNWTAHTDPAFYCSKPFGYSWFPYELAPIPKSWVATTANLVWYNQHESGGHFAALEKPKELLADVESFVAQVWPSSAAKL